MALDLSITGRYLDMVTFNGGFSPLYVVISMRWCSFLFSIGWLKSDCCVLCVRLQSFDYDVIGIAHCKEVEVYFYLRFNKMMWFSMNSDQSKKLQGILVRSVMMWLLQVTCNPVHPATWFGNWQLHQSPIKACSCWTTLMRRVLWTPCRTKHNTCQKADEPTSKGQQPSTHQLELWPLMYLAKKSLNMTESNKVSPCCITCHVSKQRACHSVGNLADNEKLDTGRDSRYLTSDTPLMPLKLLKC